MGPLVKRNSKVRESLEHWMNLADVPRDLPKASTSEVGTFIENGEIFAYLFDLLPAPVQGGLGTSFGIWNTFARFVLRSIWFIVSLVFNIITNFLPYLLLSITTLRQSNELLT